MTQKTNPQEQSTQSSRQQTKYAFLTEGIVTSADPGQSSGQHEVTVQESAVPADTSTAVIPTVHGDKYIPPVGAPVLAAPISENEYGVVGAPVPDVQTPPLDPGERIISHPISGAMVRFNSDGSIDIAGDTTVKINGGTQGIITDVQPSGTNSNGGITGLDITRDTDILI